MNTASNVLEHVIKLWDYHCMQDQLNKTDFILSMGSADERVAVHTAYLFKLGYSNLLVPSGGYGKVTKDLFNTTEAERFAKILLGFGVPIGNIIVENEASNSGENLLFVKNIFERMNIIPSSGTLVTKPYMKRRAYATAMKQWPGISWQVSAPNLSFDMYLNDTITFDMTVNLMVGDLQRLKIYAEKGFQIPQHIPEDVWASYEFLKNRGFDKYVIAQ